MEHYFTPDPKGVLRRYEFTYCVRERKFDCIGVSGTFSARELDKGTRALIELAIVNPGMRLLDLGCGWGAVGLFFAKYGCHVTMTDINLRATEIAYENLMRNHASALIECGDGYEKIEGFFDTILLNPPQTAGREVCYSLIEKSTNYLISGGSLQIVARHNKGGKMLQQRMEEVFGNCNIIGRKDGFTVYISKKTD